MSTIRIPRKKQETKEQLSAAQDKNESGVHPGEIRAEHVEETEFENAKEREELPEHYRTRIDKY